MQALVPLCLKVVCFQKQVFAKKFPQAILMGLFLSNIETTTPLCRCTSYGKDQGKCFCFCRVVVWETFSGGLTERKTLQQKDVVMGKTIPRHQHIL